MPSRRGKQRKHGSFRPLAGLGVIQRDRADVWARHGLISFRPLAGLGVIQHCDRRRYDTAADSFRPLAGLGVIQHIASVEWAADGWNVFPSPRGAWGNSTMEIKCWYLGLSPALGFRPLAGLGVIQLDKGNAFYYWREAYRGFRPLAGLGVIQRHSQRLLGRVCASFRPLAGLGVIQQSCAIHRNLLDYEKFPSPRGAWGNSTCGGQLHGLDQALPRFRPLAGLGVIQHRASVDWVYKKPGFRPLAGLGVIQQSDLVNSTFGRHYASFRPLAGLGVIQLEKK